MPTGVLADTYGHRRSVIVGFLLIGADLQAWIADELGGRDLGHVYLRGEQADYLGSLIGVCASALLAIIALNLPLLLAGALTIALSATLALVMPVHNFRPTTREDRTSWAQMGTTARSGVRLVRAPPCAADAPGGLGFLRDVERRPRPPLGGSPHH